MHLIQLLLPLTDPDGVAFDREAYDEVRGVLTERFGGVTAFLRAPARGAWKSEDGEVEHDEIVVLEVMAETLEREWWAGYRARLEARFRQDEIVVRTHPVERL